MASNLKFHIICYFYQMESVMMNISFHPLVNEDQFFKNIFQNLSREELLDLEFFSCCQICDEDFQVIPIIREKSRFSPDDLNGRIREYIQQVLG